MKKILTLVILTFILSVTSPLFAERSDSLKPELTINTGHSGSISHMEFSHDGRLIATTDHYNSAVLWDVVTGRMVRSLVIDIETGYQRYFAKPLFSRNSKYIAVRFGYDPAYLIETATGRITAKIPFRYRENKETPFFIAFAPDEKSFASAFEKNIVIIDTISGKTVSELGGLFSGHSEDVAKLAWSPDGLRLASADSSGRICLWDIKKDKMLNKIDHSGIRITGLSFTPDGKSLIIRLDKDTFATWDMESSDIRPGTGVPPELAAHDELSIDYDESKMIQEKKAISFSQQDNLLKWKKNRAGDESSVQVEKGILPALVSASDFIMSPDNRYAAVRGMIIDCETGRLKHRLEGISSSVKKTDITKSRRILLSPDGKTVIIDDEDDNFSFRDTATGKLLFTKKMSINRYTSLSSSVFFRSDNRVQVIPTDKNSYFIDLKSGAEETEAINDKAGVLASYLPDGRRIINDGFDVKNNKKLIDSVTFPSGIIFQNSRYLFGLKYPWNSLWDITTGKPVYTIDIDNPLYNYIPVFMAVTPDGKEVAVIFKYFKNNVRTVVAVFIDTLSEKVIRKFSLPDEMFDYMQGLFFSNDGKLFYIYNYEKIIAFDAFTGKQVFSYIGASASITPQGVIVSRYDNTIRFHNSMTGELIGSAGILKDSFVVAATDGRYETGPEGLKFMHWTAGTEVIPLDSLDQKYKTKGLFSQLISNTGGISDSAETAKKEKQEQVDVSKHLIGKIGSVQGNEIVVQSSRAGDLIRMGDKLFVMINGKKVILVATFPMMTVAKCRAANPADIKRIVKGMPVFK